MRLNKKMKGSFAGPLCGVVALGIIGLGISCPYLDGVYAADENSLQNLASTCAVDGDGNTVVTIDEAGNLAANGVSLGKVADGRNEVKTVENEAAENSNIQYEFPQLLCKSNTSDAVFYLDMSPARAGGEAEVIKPSEANGQLVFKVKAVGLTNSALIAQTDASMRFDVNVIGLGSSTDREPVEGSGTMTFLAKVHDFVQITRPTAGTGLDNVEIEVNPGNFGSNYTDFDVLANRGYEIHVTADDVDLTGTEGNEAKIAPIADNVAAVNANTGFGDNTWGYSIDKVSSTGTATVETYRPITSTIGEAALVVNGGTTAEESTYRFTCGTKVGSSLPADEYSTTVTISAVIPAAAAANL